MRTREAFTAGVVAAAAVALISPAVSAQAATPSSPSKRFTVYSTGSEPKKRFAIVHHNNRIKSSSKRFNPDAKRFGSNPD